MTLDRRGRFAVFNTLLDVFVLSVAAHHYSPSIAWAAAPLGLAAALRIHGAPRPRARGVRTLAVVFVAAGAWLAAAVLASVSSIDAPGAGFFLLSGLALWSDHAVLVAVSRLFRGPAVAVDGSGAGTKRLRELIENDVHGAHEDPGASLRMIACRARGASPDRLEVVVTHGFPPSEVGLPGGAVLCARENCAEGLSGRVKRIYDVLLALVALPVALVFVACGALIVLVTSGRPVFHSHTRLTLNEREFRIWKLRTMVPDAEPDGKPVWPRLEDSRATPFGGWLRRLWLDEAPQVVNVLRGDLSWVGPRPERPPFAQVLSKSIPRYGQRHRIRGGLTGLAQIEGYVGNTSLRRRTAHDLAYLERWSPWLDARIVLGTLCQLVRRKHRPAIDWEPGRGGRVP